MLVLVMFLCFYYMYKEKKQIFYLVTQRRRKERDSLHILLFIYAIFNYTEYFSILHINGYFATLHLSQLSSRTYNYKMIEVLLPEFRT